jgi:hypothetical protein
MLKLLKTFLIAVTLTTSAMAELPVIELDHSAAIDLQEITLLGQGISPRGNNKHLSLFLACISPEKIRCAKVRAIVFNSKDNSAEWLGKDLELISAEEALNIETEAQEKKLIRKKLKLYHKYFHRTYSRGAKLVGPVFGGMAGGIFAGLPMLISAGVLTSVVAWPLAIGIFITGGTLMIVGSTSSFSFGSSTKYSQALQSKEGWDWSTRSRSVSRTEFEDFYRYIKRGYPIHKRIWEKR